MPCLMSLVCCGAARGTTMPATRVARAVAGAAPASGTTVSGFGSWCPHSLNSDPSGLWHSDSRVSWGFGGEAPDAIFSRWGGAPEASVAECEKAGGGGCQRSLCAVLLYYRATRG